MSKRILLSREARAWLREKLADYAISSILGGLAGFAAGYATLVYHQINPPPVLYLDGFSGISQPAMLFDQANSEGQVHFDFEPLSLQSHITCEFIELAGESWGDRAKGYLDEYSDCFVVRQVAQDRFSVSPDIRISTLLKNPIGSEHYYCKCPESVIALQESVFHEIRARSRKLERLPNKTVSGAPNER
jgi:hypothetical protein